MSKELVERQISAISFQNSEFDLLWINQTLEKIDNNRWLLGGHVATMMSRVGERFGHILNISRSIDDWPNLSKYGINSIYLAKYNLLTLNNQPGIGDVYVDLGSRLNPRGTLVHSPENPTKFQEWREILDGTRGYSLNKYEIADLCRNERLNGIFEFIEDSMSFRKRIDKIIRK